MARIEIGNFTIEQKGDEITVINTNNKFAKQIAVLDESSFSILLSTLFLKPQITTKIGAITIKTNEVASYV